MSNYELRCANLHNKFWSGTNSILVPDRKPDLEEFVGIFDILTDDGDRTTFRIYWEIPEILGECCLPNEWNYAYYKGNYYHLTKTTYAGEFKENGNYEPFYWYTITYDDWVSDWLRNRIYLKGAITLTGDKELVRQNIYQTTPLISNVNDYRILNGIKTEGHIETRFIQADGTKYLQTTDITTADYWLLSDLAKDLTLGEPNPDKLVIPLLFKSYSSGDWRWNILKSIQRMIGHHRIYDITDEKRALLTQILHTNEVYSIASNRNYSYTYARTVNNTKYITEVDLSGCTDLVELNTITLQPLYSDIPDSPDAPPTFSIEKIVDYIYKKFELDKHLKDDETLKKDLLDITAEEIARILGHICSYSDVEKFNQNVFRDVEVEAIDRKIQEVDENVNSELRNVFDGAFPYLRFYKNFEFDDAFLDHRVMVTPRTDVNPTEEEINKLKRDFSTNDITKFDKLFKEEAHKWFNISQPLDNEYISLILQTNKYKLTCNRDCDGKLDWSRKAETTDKIIAWIPDYKRKTHVLSLATFIKTDFEWSHKDPQVLYKGKVPVVVFNELSEINYKPSSEFDKPSDYMREYIDQYKDLNPKELVGLTPINLIEVIAKGTVFYQFIVGNYNIYYKYYYSQCDGYNYCTWTQWNSSSNSWIDQAGKEPVYLSTSEYKEEWRNYHLQFTFPIHAGKTNIIILLEEYSDLDDEFLKWEVLNSNKKKGKIKKYSQFVDKNLSVIYHNKDTEKLVPPDTVVTIWLDLRKSGSLTNTFEARPQELAKKLHQVWFEDKWNEDTYGGIPQWITNESATHRHPDGRPVFRFTWVKPYNGYYYTATFKFNPPIIRKWMKFGDKKWFDYGDSKDWFIALAPDKVLVEDTPTLWINDWRNVKPVPIYTYREKATEISREAIITFLFGGYFKKTEVGDPAQWQNYRSNQGYYIETVNEGTTVYAGAINTRAISEWSGDWKDATRWHIAVRKLLNHKKSLLFIDYVKEKGISGLKTKRTNNPKTIHWEYELDNRVKGDTRIKVNFVDSEVPPFIQKFFDFTNPAFCPTLINWNNPSYTNFRDEYRTKIRKTAEQARIMLSEFNHWFELKGTNFLASIKLGKDDNYWDIELFCKDRTLIKTHDSQKWNFNNHPEKDVDVIINTNNELNIHGKKIKLKSRFTDLTPELDIGLYIKPIEDPKQSKLATFYSVSLKERLSQDLIPNTLLEVPKEVTQHVKISDFEREELIRRLGMNEIQRASEETLHNLNIEKFKMGDRHEKDKNALNFRHQVAETSSLGIQDTFFRAASGSYAGSAISNLMKNQNSLIPLFGSIFGSVSSLISSGIALGSISETFDMNEKQRIDRLTHGIKELDTKGQLMQNTHNYQRGMDNLKLLNMSTNISYPQLTNNLIYKEFNKQNNLEDVFMIQYFPSGVLKEFINKYYEEYGYEILVKDFECFGVESIRKHLRYVNIEINSHISNDVKVLIEQRATNGIKVIPY